MTTNTVKLPTANNTNAKAVCLFFKMGLRTKSIKTRKKLSIFSKELTFVVVKTTFVFEKEEKEEEVLQKKNEKHNKIRSTGFFSCHTVFYI